MRGGGDVLQSRARREETIDRYEHRADTKYLQLYQPDVRTPLRRNCLVAALFCAFV